MSIYDYNSPIISMMRKESLHIRETQQVVSNRILLSEHLDPLYGVTIDDTIEEYSLSIKTKATSDGEITLKLNGYELSTVIFTTDTVEEIINKILELQFTDWYLEKHSEDTIKIISKTSGNKNKESMFQPMFTGIDYEFKLVNEGITWVRTRNLPPKENEYYIDEVNSIVYFHPSKNLNTYTYSFKGLGANFFPASRVWTKEKNGNEVVETLQDVIDNAEGVIEIEKRFRYVNEYRQDVIYYHRNIVKYNNSIYICVDDSPIGILNKSPTEYPESWHLLTTTFSPKGTYDESITYNKGDIVKDQTGMSIHLSLSDNNVGKPLTDGSHWFNLIDVREMADTLENQEQERINNENERIAFELERQTNESLREEKINNLISLGEYSNTTTYQPRNVVMYNGSGYMCIQESTGNLPTDTNYWQKIVDKGEKGERGIKGDKGSDGINLIFKGVYDNTATYSANDLVRYNGSLFMCLQSITGVSPEDGSYWELYLQDGSNVLVNFTNTVIITEPSNEIAIGIEPFNRLFDTILVFKNSTFLQKDVDYTISEDSLKIISQNEHWMASLETPTEFNFVVLKNVMQNVEYLHGSLIEDGTVTERKLSVELQQKVNGGGIIVSDTEPISGQFWLDTSEN